MQHNWLGGDCFGLMVNMVVQTTGNRCATTGGVSLLVTDLTFANGRFFAGTFSEKCGGRVSVYSDCYWGRE